MGNASSEYSVGTVTYAFYAANRVCSMSVVRRFAWDDPDCDLKKDDQLPNSDAPHPARRPNTEPDVRPDPPG